MNDISWKLSTLTSLAWRATTNACHAPSLTLNWSRRISIDEEEEEEEEDEDEDEEEEEKEEENDVEEVDVGFITIATRMNEFCISMVNTLFEEPGKKWIN